MLQKEGRGLRQEFITFRDYRIFRQLQKAPLFPLHGLSVGFYWVDKAEAQVAPLEDLSQLIFDENQGSLSTDTAPHRAVSVPDITPDDSLWRSDSLENTSKKQDSESSGKDRTTESTVTRSFAARDGSQIELPITGSVSKKSRSSDRSKHRQLKIDDIDPDVQEFVGPLSEHEKKSLRALDLRQFALEFRHYAFLGVGLLQTFLDVKRLSEKHWFEVEQVLDFTKAVQRILPDSHWIENRNPMKEPYGVGAFQFVRYSYLL